MKAKMHCKNCKILTTAKRVLIDINFEHQSVINNSTCSICGKVTSRQYKIPDKAQCNVMNTVEPENFKGAGLW